MEPVLVTPAIAGPAAAEAVSEQPFAALLAALTGGANAPLETLLGLGARSMADAGDDGATEDSLPSSDTEPRRAATDATALSLVAALVLAPIADLTRPMSASTGLVDGLSSPVAQNKGDGSGHRAQAAEVSPPGATLPAKAFAGVPGSAGGNGTDERLAQGVGPGDPAGPAVAISATRALVQQGLPGQTPRQEDISPWTPTPVPEMPMVPSENGTALPELRIPDFAIQSPTVQTTPASPPTESVAPVVLAEVPGEQPTATPVPTGSPTLPTTIPTEQGVTQPVTFAAQSGGVSKAMVPGLRRARGIETDESETQPPGQPPTNEPETAEGVVRSDGNALPIQRTTPVVAFAPGQSRAEESEAVTIPGMPRAAAQMEGAESRDEVQEPGVPVRAPEPPPAVHQVSRAIIERAERGGGEARIRLDPAELGEVSIHIETAGTQVRIEIRAERPEAMALLRNHTLDLTSLLGERGLSLADVSVGLGQRQWAGDQDAEESRRRETGDAFAAILGLDSPEPIERHNRLRAAYNPDGAMSYRV